MWLGCMSLIPSFHLGTSELTEQIWANMTCPLMTVCPKWIKGVVDEISRAEVCSRGKDECWRRFPFCCSSSITLSSDPSSLSSSFASHQSLCPSLSPPQLLAMAGINTHTLFLSSLLLILRRYITAGPRQRHKMDYRVSVEPYSAIIYW